MIRLPEKVSVFGDSVLVNRTMFSWISSSIFASAAPIFSASGAVRVDLVNGPLLRFGPEAGVSYEKIDIDGFSEGNTLSTQASFGSQELESLTGRVDVEDVLDRVFSQFCIGK